MVAFRLGPVLFEYLPDGDDPGTGWLRVTLDDDMAEIGCSRAEWDEFVEESGP